MPGHVRSTALFWLPPDSLATEIDARRIPCGACGNWVREHQRLGGPGGVASGVV
jgi:hypothetical protein